MKYNIFIIMFILMASIVTAIDYTPTSETICANEKCTTGIYSYPKYVYEDNKWKDYTQARSLMGHGYEIKYLENDEKFNINVIDFNATSIIMELETTEVGQDIPLRIWETSEEVSKDNYKAVATQISNEKINLKSKEKQTNIYSFGFNKIIEYGYNSTTITLQTADTENLDDANIDQVSPDTSFDSLYLRNRAGQQKDSILTFTLQTINTTIYGLTVLNSSLILEVLGNNLTSNASIGGSIYDCIDTSWSEHTATWNNFNKLSRCNTTTVYNTTFSTYKLYINTTKHVQERLNKNKKNITLYIQALPNAVSYELNIKAKEYSNLSQRPKLFIEYIINDFVDLSNITQVSYFNLTSEMTGSCNGTSINATIQYKWAIYNHSVKQSNGTTTIAYTGGVLSNIKNWTGYRGDKYTFECQGFYSGGNSPPLNSTPYYIWNYTNVTLIARNVLSGVGLRNISFGIRMENGTFYTRDTGNNNYTSIITIPMNHTVNITGIGYGFTNTSFNLSSDITSQIFYFNIGVNISIKLYDEMTLSSFNMTGKTINLYLLCPDTTIIQQLTTANSTFISPCSYNSLRVVVTYPTNTYYRTITTSPDANNNLNIYLIDLGINQAVFMSYFVDDLFNQYDNPYLYVYKTVAIGRVLIHSDYLDIRNKMGVFLVQNNEYELVLTQTGLTTLNFGKYNADTAGEVSIRVYNINSAPTPTGFRNTGSWSTGVFNRTVGANTYMYAYAQFNDSGLDTTSVTWTLWKDSVGGTLLTNLTISGTGAPLARFEYNATNYITDSLYSTISYTNSQLSTHEVTVVIWVNEKIILPIITHFGTTAVNWFFLIILSTIAMIATMSNARLVTLGVAFLAGMFTLFGWISLPTGSIVPIIGLILLITLISIIKTGEGAQ